VSSSVLTRGLLAALATLVLAAPAAQGKPSPPASSADRGRSVCAVKSGSLRPSPVRACRRDRKASRALPA
jgi:hypothetical protein